MTSEVLLATTTIPWRKKDSQSVIERIVILLLKVIVTILLGFILGWAWFAFLVSRQFTGGLLFKLVITVGCGLWAGVAARIVLHRQLRLLGWCAALLSVFISLPVLSMISRGQAGFNPLQYSSNGVNWQGLGQVALGGVIAWLPLSAWRRKRARIQHSAPQNLPAQAAQSIQPGYSLPLPEPAPLKTQVVVSQPGASRVSDRPPRRRKAPAASTQDTKTSARVSSSRSRSSHSKEPGKSTRARAASSASHNTPVASHVTPDVRSIGKVRHSPRAGKQISESSSTSGELRLNRSRTAPFKVRRRAPVKLVGETEHRCPYCLEEVLPNDPAGVMICPICNTYHHKACWDITGTCQVPHKQVI